MPTFLTTRKELVSDLDAAKARIAELECQLDGSEKRAEESASQMQEVAERMSAVESTMAQLTTERDEAVARVAELEASNLELLEKAAVTDEAISLEASRMLAATTGHDPVAVDGPSDEDAPDLLGTLASLHGGERTRFWRANRQAIKEAMRR
jgi:chromosome segregation ATPase